MSMAQRSQDEYSELFYHSVQVLNDYDVKITEKTFLDEYFQSHQVSNQSFVSIVLIDCTRHGTLLNILLETFCKINEIHLQNSEENIYRVLIYLIFFQLDSIGFQFFRDMIIAINLPQAYELLHFLINETHLLTIKTECIKLYEEKYIQEQIIRVIQRYLVDLRDLTNKIKEQVSTRPSSERSIKFKPFNLTKPKPISQVNECRPTSKQQTKYEKPQKIISHHQSLQNLKKKRATSVVEKSKPNDEKQKNLQVNRFQANPPPSKSQVYFTSKIPVKLNIATVLKEHQFYKKQEEDVCRRLNDLEAGGKHAHEFLQWQQSKRKQDNEQEHHAIARKNLESKISYEEAILAKQRVIDENRQKADKLKCQTREIIEIHVREKLHKEQKMKQLIEEVVNGRDNAKLAQQKLRQYKIDFVKQYKDDVKQLMKQTLEEAEIEMRQRSELIQQIRAIESIPIDRSKPIDHTSIVGHGVHNEMSLIELHERLERLKLERDKEREARHDQIIKEKQTKEKLLTTTAQRIAKHRNELSTQTVVKKHRETSAPSILNRQNSELVELKNHLQTRKTQRLTKEILIMERLRRKFFKSKIKSSPTTSTANLYRKHSNDNEKTYLDTKNSEISKITSYFDPIADELLTIAKKSSHTIRLANLHDDLLHVKMLITQKFKENSKELFDSNKQINMLKRQVNKQSIDSDLDPESSLNTRYNRSFTSDHSMADVRIILTTQHLIIHYGHQILQY
ncbi:hypothetical protein I4U23_013766 [Adineta vaga]|nr:hypothetical protein I4U23_013766 [Adineta vaga]